MKTLTIFPRHHYLDQILPFADSSLIKVLTGQRRVGKSFILRSVEDILRREHPEANFITINLEDFAFAHITKAEVLDHELKTRISEDRKNYIFIDEIQEVSDFDKVIRSLSLNPLNDIYVTGSNSAMLSSEIASRLACRSIEIRIHPLSYCEFLEFHALDDSDDSLDAFLQFGGMPYLRNLPVRDTWPEYLSGLSAALIYRDIVSRHSIRNNDFLQRLMLFLADNIGQLFTSKRISDFLKSQHVSSSVTSVQNYVDYLCQAYIINRVRRWDIEGRRYFEIGDKYYFEDLGIRNAIVGYRSMDIGGLLENAVYNQLVFEGFDVKVGSLVSGREVDFVAEKKKERCYFQVALNVDDPSTAEREFGNLASIPDNYRKCVITLHTSAPNTRDGIGLLSLRRFLASR